MYKILQIKIYQYVSYIINEGVMYDKSTEFAHKESMLSHLTVSQRVN